MKGKGMITDKDVMYIYSEVINQMEPQKILDVGMFYKSIGAVSRRILEMEVPENCYITGVETDSISGLNVYEAIYDEIVLADDIDALLSKCSYDEYKVTVFLSDMIPEESKEMLLKKASMVSKYLFIYGTDRNYLPANCSITDVRVDNVWCMLAKCS